MGTWRHKWRRYAKVRVQESKLMGPGGIGDEFEI
jgi:hypothetical protein